MQDYFDFFGIEKKFTIDQKLLRRTYIANSKQYHPDFFTLNDDAKQEEVLRLSTLNNEGYKVLSDDRKRMSLLLSLYNMLPEEGTAQVPNDFLMDMMDINEKLMEAQMTVDKAVIQEVIGELEQLENSFDAQSKVAMNAWDNDASDNAKLETIRDVYLKQQYLKRLKERLAGTEPEV